MIRLDLGTAPPALQAEEARRLPVALTKYHAWKTTALDADRAEFTKSLTGYRDAVIEALYARQHGKCAWCERHTGKDGTAIDHFAPKAEANITPPGAARVPDQEGYWWLCWTWENLLFSCTTCNTGVKGVKFPLEPGSPRMSPPPAISIPPLPPSFYDTTVERRLLVDPRRDEPLDHLDWRPIDASKPPPTWRFDVIERDGKGDATIRTLQLKKVSHHINTHLNSALWPDWKKLWNALHRGETAEASRMWDELCTKLLNDPDQPYRGASWWALMHLRDRQQLDPALFREPTRPAVRNHGPP